MTFTSFKICWLLSLCTDGCDDETTALRDLSKLRVSTIGEMTSWVMAVS